MYIIKRDELYHYGVKGMKWGVRKDKVNKIKSSTVKKARNAANYYKNVTGARSSAAVKKYRRKNIDGMSDADIRKAINRMNLEKDYRNLTKADILRGKRFADSAFDYRAKYKTIRKITTKA